MERKVLIVTALAGFIRSFLINDIRILQGMGYEVHCAANKNHPGAENIDEYFKDENIIFHQVDFSSNDPFSKQTLVAVNQMKKIINNYNFSLVHCHTPIAGAICRWVCKKKRKWGMKVIYTTHGFYFHNGSSKKSWVIFRTIENIMSRLCDVIITINKEDYSNAKKMHCKDVRYINGVGVNTIKFKNMEIDRTLYRKQLGIKDDELMVLAIGELSKRKNHQIIIKALAEIKDIKSVFVICGNSMNTQNTVNELEEMSGLMEVNLKLMGLRNDIPEICKCADIGVLPSSREGLGLAGIEMLASGLPVVGSNVQGITDYIKDGRNGYLCNPYDEKEFATAIRKLVDSGISQNLRDMCSKSVEDFDIKKSYQQMKDIYYSLLNKSRG